MELQASITDPATQFRGLDKFCVLVGATRQQVKNVFSSGNSEKPGFGDMFINRGKKETEEAIRELRWADSIYHSYAALLNTAKAVLIGENIKTNTQAGIIRDFDQYFVTPGLLELESSFSELIYRINQEEPTEKFAREYRKDAVQFYQLIDNLRKNSLENE